MKKLQQPKEPVILEEGGLSPWIDVYSEVPSYITTIGTILSGIKPRHREHAKALRQPLLIAESTIYREYRRKLQKHHSDEYITDEEMMRWNESIRIIRHYHRNFIDKINEKYAK